MMSVEPSSREASDVVVVGGGAAGLMAAIWAARGGASVRVLEGASQCGLKILVSGGGRCNVLPSEVDLSDYYTAGSRNLLKRWFRSWRLAAVHRFFENDLGLPLVVEPDTGKVFPRAQSARAVRDALVGAVRDAGGAIETEFRVNDIVRDDSVRPDFGAWRIVADDGRVRVARRIVLASGGRSLPKTGSDGHGYTFATSLGHTLLATYPALVPLTTDDARIRELAGIALPIEWRAILDGRIVEERTRELLFTHRGLSGPAILDASHWVVRDRARLEISWGAHSVEHWRQCLRAGGARQCSTIVSEILPRRLTRFVFDRADVSLEMSCAQLPKSERERLIARLTRDAIPISGSVGYRVAEVTGGGIPIGEVDPSSLESRRASGLHLCGEILDCIGRIGGYNFLWAWITGRLAGSHAARL